MKKGVIYMKKIGSVCIGMLFIIGLCTIIFMPIGKALVWVTPMKMLAEGNITDATFCKVEKAIILRNDGNDSVFVSLNATGIDVIFEEGVVELKAGERKIIHPVLVVREGRHEGTISITGYEEDIETEGVGSHVVSSMSITVTTTGTRISSSAEFAISESGSVILFITLGGAAAGGVAVVFILLKKKRSAVRMIRRKARCPSCHEMITISGNPGDVVKVACQKCGNKGRVAFPKSTSSKRVSMKAGGS